MAIELPDARHLSDEGLRVIRERALRGVELGFTQTELAELLGVCQETISRWWAAYASEGPDALPGRRTGRPPGSGRMLTNEQAERIKALIDNNSAQKLGLSHALWTRRAVGDLVRKELDMDLADRTVGLHPQEAHAPLAQARPRRGREVAERDLPGHRRTGPERGCGDPVGRRGGRGGGPPPWDQLRPPGREGHRRGARAAHPGEPNNGDQ